MNKQYVIGEFDKWNEGIRIQLSFGIFDLENEAIERVAELTSLFTWKSFFIIPQYTFKDDGSSV